MSRSTIQCFFAASGILCCAALAGSLLVSAEPLGVEDKQLVAVTGGIPAVAPEPVTEADVAALKAESPFLRPLDLSKSLTLRGISRIEGNLFATLRDRETKKTYVVSASANDQGWRLVGLAGNQADLKTLIAQVSVAGGEVFPIRFDESQLQPNEGKRPGGPGAASRRGPGGGPPGTNFREGVSGDGFRGPPPPEMIQKLEKLTPERREKLIRQIGELRSRNPDLSSDDRRMLFSRMLDRAVQEKQ
jgi:hypothetical protein